MGARLAALFAACALAGCRGLSLAEVDDLQDGIGVRTVLREERFTLWSPLDVETSRAWAELVARELPAVEGAFDPARLVPERLQVLLERVEAQAIPIPAEGGSVTVQIYPRGSRHGVLGHASGDVVTLFLAPPNRFRLGSGHVIESETDPASLTSVLRHELAHVAARRAGLELATWLSEGAADVVEGLELREGELVDAGPSPEALERARALERGEWRVAALLDWSESGARVTRGEEQVDLPRRQLCGLYVRWLLGLRGDGRALRDLADRLAALDRRTRAELLAGEPAWRAWLEAETAAEAP
ncbi:MAG TPA: hypothetical protein VMT18_10225 [Planctomycetota bacterium]|nr:hypothetical protein [Planctomycetota bacterium]